MRAGERIRAMTGSRRGERARRVPAADSQHGWWQTVRLLFRKGPAAAPAEPLTENPNPQLRPRINLPYVAGHGDTANDRYNEFSRNMDRRHLVLAADDEDEARPCTSCGKSERKARWMITGLSVLLCDECVKQRIRRVLGWRR